MTTTPPHPSAFTILAVCTGNICRSPAIERWLRLGLREEDGIHVASAGVHAVVGAPVSPPMAALIVEGGGDARAFAARQISAELVRDASLVLTATRGHRASVLGLVPAAVRRTFTLREFARLAGRVDAADLDRAAPASAGAAARLRVLVPLAYRRRADLIVPADEDDVVDPIGRPLAVYRRSAAQIRPAVDAIVGVALGRPPAGAGRPAPREVAPPAGDDAPPTRRSRAGRR